MINLIALYTEKRTVQFHACIGNGNITYTVIITLSDLLSQAPRGGIFSPMRSQQVP